MKKTIFFFVSTLLSVSAFAGDIHTIISSATIQTWAGQYSKAQILISEDPNVVFGVYCREPVGRPALLLLSKSVNRFVSYTNGSPLKIAFSTPEKCARALGRLMEATRWRPIRIEILSENKFRIL